MMIDKRDKIIELIKGYSKNNPHFTYGLDEMMNMYNIDSLDDLNLTEEEYKYIDRIRNKRIRMLRSMLVDSNTSATQLKGIELELGWERENKQEKNNIEISLVSNIMKGDK